MKHSIFNGLKKKLLGDNKEYKRRTELIFDEKVREEYIEKQKNRNKKRYIFLIVSAAILTLILCLSNAFYEEEFVMKNGHITCIQRPSSQEGAATYRLSVFDSGKETGIVSVTVNPKIDTKNGNDEKSGKNGEKTDASDSKNAAETSKSEKAEKRRTECEKIAKNLSASTEGAFLILPGSFADGRQLEFRKYNEHSGIVYLCLLTIAGLLIVYSARYKTAENDAKNARDDIEKELPGFINSLVLLLEAGLVLSSALEKAACAGKRNSYFYERLSNISEKVSTTNTSFVRELVDFSRKSGVREFVRASGIIADNFELGSELCEKLSAESEILWHTRKKSVIEKGHIAETKLTIPLVILLLVLILVTIAPAMMEM